MFISKTYGLNHVVTVDGYKLQNNDVFYHLSDGLLRRIGTLEEIRNWSSSDMIKDEDKNILSSVNNMSNNFVVEITSG